jgi:uncharacterized protein (DUF433 family)
MSIGEFLLALADASEQGTKSRFIGLLEAIQKSKGVMGGAACIRETRIPVWLLVSFKMQGMSNGELLRAYPTLEAADLAAAWGYFG